jgi:hypothetical protein
MASGMKSFVEQLAGHFPELQPLLQEHLDDNFGELLPTVFFGDLTRLAVDDYSSGRAEQVQALLDYLEESFATGGPEIRELISVGFLENLPGRNEANSGIRDRLGPHLSEELSRVN